ncbi:MAG TPA: YhjD/YihY/BrkB family envelope integrity protein [Gaiellales bacterium]|jgi:membrane protein|nr:YhjD/YihY/BrkB family envelope integrity protein [Gaiellales bacterium]
MRARVERTLIGQIVVRIVDLNPVERGLALGSKLFTAVIPLAIIMSALVSSRDVVATRLIEGFGLTGAGAASMRELLRVPAGETGSSISVIGLLVLVYSALSFSRSLQRVYVDAWRLPPMRSQGIAWGLLWIVAFAVWFSLSTPVSRVLHAHGFHVGAIVVSLALGSILWMVTPFILLGRRVAMRELLPGGIATAILLVLFNLGSRLYLPHSTTSNVHRYGLVGVTFTILTWLFAFSLTLIASAAIGAVLSERRRGGDAGTAPPASTIGV